MTRRRYVAAMARQVTVADYAQLWLDGLANQARKATTLRGYRSAFVGELHARHLCTRDARPARRRGGGSSCPIEANVTARRGLNSVLTGYTNIAILMAMSLSEHLSLADMKNRLSEVVDRLEREHGRVVVTKHGRPAAVMLSIEDFESLEETLEILSNPALVATIGEGREDAKAGRVAQLSREEVMARIGQR